MHACCEVPPNIELMSLPQSGHYVAVVIMVCLKTSHHYMREVFLPSIPTNWLFNAVCRAFDTGLALYLMKPPTTIPSAPAIDVLQADTFVAKFFALESHLLNNH